MRAGLALLLLAAAGTAAASEVTVFRPAAFIADEWAYYILLGDRVATDLKSGERVTLQVPAETRALVVHCPRALGGYEASRIDYDFKANPRAWFVLTARPECVNIQPVDASAAAGFTRQTRERLARPVQYDPGRAATTAAPAAASIASAAAAPAVDAAAAVSAATAAGVEAFNSRDPARIGALYDPEAVLSDTTEAKPRVGATAIADYYKSAAQRPTQRVALGERNIRVFGDTAIDSGTYNVFEMRNGQATVTPMRYTLVYGNRGGKWLIVDHQSAPAAR
ncbi:MAG TPA: SgcJ/EcaC family oxidoreductase [Burkholderiales bacterium]|nr:SgcJ/EcaC family oxidoreductase [Burkholderiales bacterium]